MRTSALLLSACLFLPPAAAGQVEDLAARLESVRRVLLALTEDARGAPGVFRKRTAPSARAMDRLAVIVCGRKAGTGFILNDAGRPYLVTNAHVVEDGHVLAKLLNGSLLSLGRREFAEGRDLARFALAGDLPAFAAESALPAIGDPVTVFGNSDGCGVITEIRGRVLGVGPQEFEIDAKFVSGNSGSPVLDRDGRVIGVASYLKNYRNDADWSKKNTRFNGIRRFALRLNGVRWCPR